jgi:ribonuclease-3
MTPSKLHFKPVHLDKKMKRIQDAVRTTREKTPKKNSRLRGKLSRWARDLEKIQHSLERIDRKLRPNLEKEIGLDIKNRELLQVAMFQPSTKNIFLEMEIHYQDSEESPLGDDGFADLVNLSEMARVLALLGDAAISMAVLERLWSPSVSDVGVLTQKRADIVSNEHMAQLCDKWHLYEHRIHFDPGRPSKDEMEHDKGTLLEAVYGIIQLERGFRGVRERISHLF